MSFDEEHFDGHEECRREIHCLQAIIDKLQKQLQYIRNKPKCYMFFSELRKACEAAEEKGEAIHCPWCDVVNDVTSVPGEAGKAYYRCGRCGNFIPKAAEAAKAKEE